MARRQPAERRLYALGRVALQWQMVARLSEPRHALHVAQGNGTSIVSQAVQREQMICSVPVGFGQHP
jgi:hypothetical protein